MDKIFFFDFFFFPFSNIFDTEPKSSTSDALNSNCVLLDLNLNSTSCSTFLFLLAFSSASHAISLFNEENFLSKYFLTSANELFALRSSLFPLLEDSDFDETDGEGEREREVDFEAFLLVRVEDMSSRYSSCTYV